MKKLVMGMLIAGGVAPLMLSQADAAEESKGTKAPAVRYQSVADPVHEVHIDGSSNVVNWDATGQEIIGGIDVPATWSREGGELRLEPDLTADQGPRTIRAWIPVVAIEGDRDGLSDKMHKTMDASSYQFVTFGLNTLETLATHAESGGARWEVRGDLTVSGVSRDVDLTLTAIPQTDGRIQVELEKALKMTDFDVEPPTALGGFVRAYDEVDVSIRWVLERQSPQPTTPQAEVSDAAREAINGLLEAYSEMYQGVRELERDRIESASEDASSELEALEEDPEALEEPVTALGEALGRLGEAEGPDEIRSAFAEASGALKDLLEVAGHEQETSVIAYRYPDEEGVAASEWLQVDDSEGGVATPYSENAPIGLPEVVAIYPGQGLSAGSATN